MVRIVLYFFTSLLLVYACSSKESVTNIQAIISKNAERRNRNLPIIDTTWNFYCSGEMFVWENPELKKKLDENLPVYARKVVYYKDSILTEEDIFYSGLRKSSKVVDPPYTTEDYERIIIVNTWKEIKVMSFYCPDLDTISFATVKNALKIINKWGIAY